MPLIIKSSGALHPQGPEGTDRGSAIKYGIVFAPYDLTTVDNREDEVFLSSSSGADAV